MNPHTLLTHMMTNYLNPSMYLIWITFGVPLILKSGKVFRGPAELFMLSFFTSIIGVKITLAIIVGHFWEFLLGLWYRRIMLGLSLIDYTLLLIKKGLAIMGRV